jgi:hypothetical protein
VNFEKSQKRNLDGIEKEDVEAAGRDGQTQNKSPGLQQISKLKRKIKNKKEKRSCRAVARRCR